MRRALLACVVAGLVASPCRAEEPDACDRLAGNPEDPGRVGPGVFFFSIDAPAAVVACTAAVKDHPDTVRFKYQLALALAREDHLGEAVIPLREAAEAGYAPAEADLGYAMRDLRAPGGTEADAFRWSMRAAEQGYTPGMNDVGYDFAYGRGVAVDLPKALQWYRRAIALGDRYADKYLGDLYRDGRGVPQSDEDAVHWYALSAARGYRHGETALALMLLAGRGAPKDVPRAIGLLKQAAAQEDLDAAVKLAELKREGAADADLK